MATERRNREYISSEDQTEIIDPSLKEKKVPYHVTKKVWIKLTITHVKRMI